MLPLEGLLCLYGLIKYDFASLLREGLEVYFGGIKK